MAGEIGITVLDRALELVKSYIDKAQQEKLEDIKRCRDYLHAVQEAIKGLENEYDEILNQAEACDLSQLQQIGELEQRITDYLFVDKLRTELVKAIAGLEECERALRERTNSFLQKPWMRENREVSLAMFSYLLERLTDYLKELEGKGLRHRRSGTGVGIRWLWEIKNYLDNFLQSWTKLDKSELTSIVTRAREDRDKDNLMYYTREIERISNILLLAFR